MTSVQRRRHVLRLCARFFFKLFICAAVCAASALTPVWQEGGGEPLPFRYKVTPKATINVFEPRALPPNSDINSLRGTMLGAAIGGHFDKLPKQSAALVWEAGLYWRKRSQEISPSCLAA